MSSENNRLIGFDNTELESHTYLIGYNKNDFFYNSSSLNISENLPTISDCSNMDANDTIYWDTSCNANVLSEDNIQPCIKRELCLNRQYGEKIIKLQNNHYGADQNYLDTKQIYYFQYLQSINLGIGIIAILYAIYTVRKYQ